VINRMSDFVLFVMFVIIVLSSAYLLCENEKLNRYKDYEVITFKLEHTCK